jgi:hypothetical protein
MGHINIENIIVPIRPQEKINTLRTAGSIATHTEKQ